MIRRRGERCVPERMASFCSVLYQKFDVLNQINKLRLNEKPIDVQLKKDLYNDLFLNFPKVSIVLSIIGEN